MPLTNEDRARGGRVGQVRKGLNRHWYKKMLLDIAEGTIECTGVQLSALKAFAEANGWFPPKSRRNVVSEIRLKDEKLKEERNKPAVSDDLMGRMAILMKQAEVDPENREQLRKEQA